MVTAAATGHRELCDGPRKIKPYAAPVVVAAIVVVCAYAFSPNFRLSEGPTAPPFAGDFLQEWLGGYIVRVGDHARFYDPIYAETLQHDAEIVGFRWDESRYLPIVYPPFYYVILAPLSLLPVRTAAAVWAVLMVAALAASLWLLHRAAEQAAGFFAKSGRIHHRDGTGDRLWDKLAPWSILAAVLFAPLVESLTSSQKGTLCLLILTATFLFLNARRPFAAGIVFGLLAFKPQLTLVIAISMLLKRQWRFVGGGALTGGLLAGLSLMLGGDVCRQYFAFATGAPEFIGTSGYDLHKSHCLYGFFTLLGGEASGLVKPATLVAMLGVAGVVAVMLRGPLELGCRRFGLQFCGLVIAALVASPHLFTYDLTILLLPMFLLGFAAWESRTSPPGEIRQRPESAWLPALLLGLFAVSGFSTTIALQTGLQLTVPLMVLLLVTLAWASFAARRQTATKEPLVS